MADQFGDIVANGDRLVRRTARLFLDDPLQQADDKGDARRLHRLQIDRRQQPRQAGRGGQAVGCDIVEAADRLSGSHTDIAGRVAHFTNVADGGAVSAGDIDEDVVAHRDDQRMREPCDLRASKKDTAGRKPHRIRHDFLHRQRVAHRTRALYLQTLLANPAPRLYYATYCPGGIMRLFACAMMTASVS